IMHTGGCNARARPSGKGATTPTAPPTTLRCVGATAQEGATARSRTHTTPPLAPPMPQDGAPMRIAILSDIHANSDALAAVLADIARHDVAATVHLGDVVGYNTRPRETLALLREHRIPGVRGNHDLMAIGRIPADQCGP